MRLTIALGVLLLIGACRGDAPQQLAEGAALDSLVLELMPTVAEVTGLEFRDVPRAALRSREQVRQYLLTKLDNELPPRRLEGLVSAYRLLGMLPDTLDLARLFVDLYTEQVAGFYDPDSAMFFAISGTNRTELRLVMAHELVHALQHQYLPLDSILDDRSDADRLAAAQAVLEGHATLATIQVLAPDAQIFTNDAYWDVMRKQFSSPQQGMEVFNRAPLVVRVGLIFPYLQGSEFMRWYRNNHGTGLPVGSDLPASTEQILHPARYADGDAPIRIRFEGDTTGVLHEDTFGEFESHVLRSSLVGIEAVPTELPLGWGGDRMRVYESDDGPALIWVMAFDEVRYADRFRERVAASLLSLSRENYRTDVSATEVGGHPGVRVVIAPTEWGMWSTLPAAILGEAIPAVD